MITSITATENKLVSVHNPTSYMCVVGYTDEIPQYLNLEIKTTDDLGFYYISLGNFNPYIYTINEDNNTVTFRFDGDQVLFSFMDTFDDFLSQERVVERIEMLTKHISLTYSDPDSNIEHTIYSTLVNSSTQITESFDPELYMKDTILYIGAEEEVVYIYMFSDGSAPIVKDPTLGDYEEVYISDYDDYIFTAYDDTNYVANINI